MKNIKQIIEQRQNDINKKEKGMNRIYLNPEEEDFKKLFLVEAQNYIIQNGGKKDFDENIILKEVKINGETWNNLKFINLVKYFQAYLARDSKAPLDFMKGIIFCGSYGVGKTLLLTSFVNVFNLISESKKITKIHSNDIAKFISDDKYDYLTKRPLYIEDIGREAEEINHYGTVYYPLYNLILDRYKERAWTFGCSNFAPDVLRNHYGGYIADRMRVMFNVIEITDKSKRR